MKKYSDDREIGSQKFYNMMMEKQFGKFQGEENILKENDSWKLFLKKMI